MREALSVAINRPAIVVAGHGGRGHPGRPVPAAGQLQLRAGARPAALRSGARQAAARRGRLSERAPHHAAQPERPLPERRQDRPGDRADVDARRRADRGRDPALDQLRGTRQQAGLLGIPARLGQRDRGGLEPASRAGRHVGSGARATARPTAAATPIRRSTRSSTRRLATADDGAREKLLQQATQMAFDDVAIIPLHNQKNTWAMRAGLTYDPARRRGRHGPWICARRNRRAARWRPGWSAG